MIRLALILPVLVFLACETPDAAQTPRTPLWERHGNILVGVSAASFESGFLMQGTEVDGDVLFDLVVKPCATCIPPYKGLSVISVWVPKVALPKIERDLREVYGVSTWSTRVLGNPFIQGPPPPPESLARVFRMSQDERIGRLERIEKRPASNLAVIIQDQEVDLGRWRTELNLMKDNSTAKRLELAESILSSMESRLRIWLDRYIDKL